MLPMAGTVNVPACVRCPTTLVINSNRDAAKIVVVRIRHMDVGGDERIETQIETSGVGIQV
jgi:hypothetical protein